MQPPTFFNVTVEPSLEQTSSMKATKQFFNSWDGTKLFYRAWNTGGARRALVLFHRGHEHSGRWQETVEALGRPDTAIFAWDARGHGNSPGERGSADSLAAVIRDTNAFIHHLSREYGIAVEDMIVLAHSVGAVTAATWVHDYAPPIRGLILAVPAFRVKLYVPLALPLLRLKQKLFGPGYVKSYVKSNMLTHDSEQAASYDADPLIFRQIAVNILLDLHDTSTRLLKDAGAITTPTLILTAGSDWVVKTSAQQIFFDRISSPLKRLEMLPGFNHAIFQEKDRHIVIGKTKDFIEKCFERSKGCESLLHADRDGYTKKEYDRLCGPGNGIFAVTRLVLQTIGRLSEGIKLGWKTGFDSGRTLDYVYENRAQGVTPLGRLIDRTYLSSIGWRGIRERKVNLKAALRDAIEATHREGKPVRILDIASGPGRYVLETVRELSHIPIEVMLRDYKAENVEAARELARRWGIKNVTVAQADAFDRSSIAAVTPKPTIAIVSGLYELFPDNALVQRSLGGLADAVEPGGCLIYTNQPWHPQVEFIARVLTNREGKPWIMRRRTQAEMDQLVSAAGFEKHAQLIDGWGMFSVSVAKLSMAGNS